MIAITICLLSLGIIFSETILTEVVLFKYLNLLFLVVNLLFWYKRYKIALIVGFLSSIIIDLILQNSLGRSMFSLFVPILVLNLFDIILKLEGKLTRIIFSSVGTLLSIFINYVLFGLLFLNDEISIEIILKRGIFSLLVLLILSMFIEKFLPMEKKNQFL